MRDTYKLRADKNIRKGDHNYVLEKDKGRFRLDHSG